MGKIYRKKTDKNIWFQKTWDLNNGYGYHVQVYWKRYCGILNMMIHDHISYGFSKNKFKAVKMALNK